jgi:hypothetical protein
VSWKKITETDPPPGTSALCYGPGNNASGNGYEIGHLDSMGWGWSCEYITPEYWMPLPAPPQSPSQSNG